MTTDQERIVQLELRIANLEARIAAVEFSRMTYGPIGPRPPEPWPNVDLPLEYLKWAPRATGEKP